MSFPQDRRVRQEAAALLRSGCNVSVVCPKGRGYATKSFEVVDQVEVYRYWQPCQGKNVPGYLAEYTWATICTFVLTLWIWMTSGFDVLHAANPPDLFFLVAAPFVLLGKRFVFDQHDLCPELFDSKMGDASPFRGLLLFAEACSYKLASLVIVTNQSACDLARQRGANANKIRIVRNGPDLDHFAVLPPDPALKSGASFMAVYVGALGAQDGVDSVVKAADYIVHHRKRKDVVLAILGDGDCMDDLRGLARDLKVEEFVNFVGWVGDSELFRYLSTADVCLAPDPPSRINHLSTFIKIMEYMFFGKVTVSFDLLESRRSARTTAIYVKGNSPRDFGDAVLGILDSPKFRARMGKDAAERVRSSLHWGVSRSVLLDAYRQLIWKESASIVKTPEPIAGAATDKGKEMSFRVAIPPRYEASKAANSGAR